MKRLENKVAIITGASQGMGASHARVFAEEGAKVILTDVNEQAARPLQTNWVKMLCSSNMM